MYRLEIFYSERKIVKFVGCRRDNKNRLLFTFPDDANPVYKFETVASAERAADCWLSDHGQRGIEIINVIDCETESTVSSVE